MSDPIATFFEAWQLESDDARLSKIRDAVAESIEYDDPRTTQTLKGAAALSEYVGMFSANAPGWGARLVGSDTIAGVTRATVAFGGPGPDGNDVVQLGQYFVEYDGDRIGRMVGFAGMGAQE